MTADTNEALDALVNALRSGEQADMDGTMVRVSRQACEEAADMLTAQAAKLAEAEAVAEGALMILMDERSHADRLAEALEPAKTIFQIYEDDDAAHEAQLALAAHQKRRVG